MGVVITRWVWLECVGMVSGCCRMEIYHRVGRLYSRVHMDTCIRIESGSSVFLEGRTFDLEIVAVDVLRMHIHVFAY